jgi:hypothetical protein
VSKRFLVRLPAQRMMANRAGAKTVDQSGSHSVYVSQPQAVAAIIEDAAWVSATN